MVTSKITPPTIQTIDLQKQKMSRFVAVSKDIERYKAEKGESYDYISDTRFQNLVKKAHNFKADIRDLSPTAASRYPDISLLPDFAPDLSNIITKCLFEDFEKSRESTPTPVSFEDFQIGTEVEIGRVDPNKKIDFQVVTTSDGEEIYVPTPNEVQKVTALTGDDAKRLGDVIKQMMSKMTILEEDNLQLRQELQLMEDSQTDFREQGIKEAVETAMQNASVNSSLGLKPDDLNKLLLSAQGQDMIANSLSLRNYQKSFSGWYKELIDQNIDAMSQKPITPFGTVLLQKVKYHASNQVQEAEGWKALQDILFEQVQSALSKSIENKPELLSNHLGDNINAYKEFYNILDSSLNFASAQLGLYNNTIPKSSLVVQARPISKYMEKPKTLIEQMTSPSFVQQALGQATQPTQQPAWALGNQNTQQTAPELPSATDWSTIPANYSSISVEAPQPNVVPLGSSDYIDRAIEATPNLSAMPMDFRKMKNLELAQISDSDISF